MVFLLLQSGAVPRAISADLTITLLVMVVLGGVGSRWGAVIGGVFYTILDQRLTTLANSDAIDALPDILRIPLSEPLFTLGTLFILVVLFLPGGLTGTAQRLGQRRNRRVRDTGKDSTGHDRRTETSARDPGGIGMTPADGLHTLGRWTTDRSHATPHRIAVDDRGCTLSYGELERRATFLAAGLAAAGYVTGDRIATLTGNSSDHVVVFFACAKAGLVLVPLSWRLSPRELAAQLELADPQLLLVEDELDSLAAGACTLLAAPAPDSRAGSRRHRKVRATAVPDAAGGAR